MNNKNNHEYWRQRAINYERDWYKRCKETVEKRLARHYMKALTEIKSDILQLYAMLAKENGLDFNEARRILRGREFKEWRFAMSDYLKNHDGGLTKDISALALRSNITRLEKLHSETLRELDRMGRNVNDDMKKFLSGAYKETYARDVYDMVKTGKLSVPLTKVDSSNVERVLAARWSGKNYSERIWKNTHLLSRTVRETIATGVHRGLSIEQLSRRLDAKMHAGYSNAERLVQTEMNFVNNQARADSMEAAGIMWYEFIAVMDNRTSAMCRSRDGESYPLEEKSVGFNYPPLHPRCRSTVAPYIEELGKRGKRRVKVNGEMVRIPASMTYKEYKAVYIDKKITLDQWQKSLSKTSQNAIIIPNKPTLTGSSNCKDFDELREYWKKNYNVRLNKPLGSLDFEAVREATQGVEDVISEFPKAGKFLRKMKVENLDYDDAIMSADYYGVIAFNKCDFHERESLLEGIAINIEVGQSPKNTGIKGVAGHEMGHLLERALIDKYDGDINDWRKGTYAKKVVREAVDAIRKTPEGKISYRDKTGKARKRYVTIEQLESEISLYAKDRSGSETIAEAVCDYITNGENASWLSKEVWRILKRELG